MDQECATRASIVCYLTDDGIVDALRRGTPVSGRVVYDVDPQGDLWERVFALDPEPIWDEAEYGYQPPVEAVELTIGRIRKWSLRNSEPELLYKDFMSEESVYAWDEPEIVETITDDIARSDTLRTPEELVAFEEDFRRHFDDEVQKAWVDIDELWSLWGQWSRTTGLESATRVLKWAREIDQSVLPYASKEELEQVSRDLDLLISTTKDAGDIGENAIWSELAAGVGRSWRTVERLQEKARKELANRAELAEAKSWVAEHGSSRLKKAMEAKLLVSAMGAYRDERLALERPGWSWLKETKETVKGIVNPSEEALDALLKAQEWDQYAQLFFSPSRGPVVRARYLGRRIELAVSPLNEEPF